MHINACTAYSNGRRVNVAATDLNTNSVSAPHINLTGTNRWGHVCLNPVSGQPEFTTRTGNVSATDGMPTFSAKSPILCLADVVSTTSGPTIDNLYDVRTFSSSMKEAVNTSSAVELGMLADASSTGAMIPAASCPTASSSTCSKKLYGLVVATDGSTSGGAPNAIVTTAGPAWVKTTAAIAGEFVRSGPTAGYGFTVSSIPNNAFYFSAGNTRTNYSTGCTSTSDCAGSVYVNFIVR